MPGSAGRLTRRGFRAVVERFDRELLVERWERDDVEPRRVLVAGIP
jgi:hypothetical protein